MIRICIIDDEQTVRESIVEKLHRLNVEDRLQVFDIGFGLEALNKLDLIRPELVITDIMMPTLNGLALLEEIRKRHWETEVVVLSGYDEFEYAQQAMKHGALQYLLKPASRQALAEAVQLVGRRLRTRWEAEMQLLTDRIWMQHQMKITIHEVYQPAMWLDARVPKLIELSGRGRSQTRSEEYTIFTFSIDHDHAGQVRIAADTDRRGPGLFHTADKFSSSLIRAEEGWQSVHFFERPDRQVSRSQGSFASQEIRRLNEKLVDLLVRSEIDELAECLSDWFETAEGLPIAVFRKECAKMLAIAEVVMTTRRPYTIYEDEQVHYWQMWVLQASSWVQLKYDILYFIKGGMRALLQESQAEFGDSDVVEQALALLHQSTDSKLGLSGLAEQLHLHPVTLSKLIKHKTGMNFIDHVVRHKLDRGKSMLDNTNKSIAEIAEEIGYLDFRYFSKLFKKTYGLTPKDYRTKKFTQ
ncbi:response regulator [Paenibacillus sp. J5C_2022]|uniref:response regulator transcription factor n=1 Tax=Paenibacillus sp. J5C2022 TaxID=2977129 RepID=UPI0021CECA23|nr:response regulator [Paenibacillus sp. J5C2022]MCU6708101.1 response regulator [Paenibacillus sp. J5C2022]